MVCLGGVGASSGSGGCVDDDELSDTISEKGGLYFCLSEAKNMFVLLWSTLFIMESDTICQ